MEAGFSVELLREDSDCRFVFKNGVKAERTETIWVAGVGGVFEEYDVIDQDDLDHKLAFVKMVNGVCQIIAVRMDIDLCACDRLVTEELLNDTEIDLFSKAGSKRMT